MKKHTLLEWANFLGSKIEYNNGNFILSENGNLIYPELIENYEQCIEGHSIVEPELCENCKHNKRFKDSFISCEELACHNRFCCNMKQTDYYEEKIPLVKYHYPCAMLYEGKVYFMG